MSAALTQTRALLVDAYRELNSKKLFWITLALSVLVVGVTGMFGINEKGITILWWEFSLPLLNTTLIPKTLFYKYIFAKVAVPIWLTWGATILALVSVSSLFPDFLASGAIELTLSKPIARTRLFLTKFMMGLLFVALQVSAFAFTSYLVIGLRGGGWELRLFWAVPIVLLFFSYLYSVNALLGLVTRSTIASLLLTMLFWAFLFSTNLTDQIFTQQKARAQTTKEQLEKRVGRVEKLAQNAVKKAKDENRDLMVDGKLPEGASDELEAAYPMLRTVRKNLATASKDEADWTKYCQYCYLGKSFFPKTSETIGLLDRHLLSPEDRERIKNFARRAAERNGDPESDEDTPRRGNPEADLRAEDIFRGRPTWWVMGTSVAFECVVLGLAVVIFSRRDF